VAVAQIQETRIRRDVEGLPRETEVFAINGKHAFLLLLRTEPKKR
jgi:hypothetical protein